MIQTLLGIKSGMAQSYDTRGRRVGATVIELPPNLVTQVKNENGKDKYNAVQIGIGIKKSVKKPQIGHLKKAGIETKIRWMREVRMDGDPSTVLGTIQPGTEMNKFSPGQEIKLDQVFSRGDAVKVTGISKGRGFQGGVRRHGFHGGPKTHGQSDRHRAPGSIGSGTTPGRVYKGKRMAGHMGAERVSYRGLEVVEVDKENNLLTIKGGVPGPNGGLVMVEKLGRIKGYTPPPDEKPEEESSEDSENSENQKASESEKSDEPESLETKEGEKNAS